ncbi:MAG: hypothetical protein JWN82_320 [Candidatus Saccharibacteria bacterium]|nr:hypothetical protein [Candidatus Saccharibacteria bacterium]
MDSLFNILKRKDYDMPPEVAAIKQYIRDEFHAEVEVLLREKDIVIVGRSSALIGSLRLHGPHIKKAAQTDKRLVFRIG